MEGLTQAMLEVALVFRCVRRAHPLVDRSEQLQAISGDGYPVGLRGGAGDAKEIVAADGTEVDQGLLTAKALGHVGLDGDARQGVVAVPGGFDDRAIKHTVGDRSISGSAVGSFLPVTLGIKVGSGLAAIAHTMDQSKPAAVV